MPANPLDVPIHLQDTEKDCGLACAQMVARFLDGHIRQQTAFAAQAANAPGWTTSPNQLREMLNQFRPASMPPFKVFKPVSARTALNRARDAVAQGFPAVALVRQGGHWLVIHGFTGKDGMTMHLRNPAPDRTLLTAASPLPPHADGDRCEFDNSSTPTGGDDEIMDYTYFVTNYFKACKAQQAVWNGKRICVAPDVPVAVPPPVPEPEPLEPEPPPPPTGPRLTADEAGQAAWAALDQAGVKEVDRWKKSLANVNPQDKPLALLVNGQDDQRDYYLVLLISNTGRGALVGVDATSGEFVFAKLNPPARLIKQLQSAAKEHLIWAPARESFFSPFFPIAERVMPNGDKILERVFDNRRIDGFSSGVYDK